MESKINFSLKDCLFFDKMIVPTVIKYLYWLSLAIALITSLAMMFQSVSSFFIGIISFICSVIFIRIFYELIIVVFKIYEKLSVIADNGSIEPKKKEDKKA